MQRLVLAAGVILATSPAGADPSARASAGPPWALGLDYTVARGGRMADLDLGWRLETGPMLRVGRMQATASISTSMKVTSARPERDTDQLAGMGLGGRLAYDAWRGEHASLVLGLGFERIWLDGDGTVQRECRQALTCIAGFYTEEPSYHAWAPQLRIGLGLTSAHPGVLFRGVFDLIVEPLYFSDVPPSGLHGVALYGAFDLSFGFGPKRRAGR